MNGLTLAPLLPINWLGAFALIGFIFCLWTLYKAPLSGLVRTVTLALLLFLLANPSLRQEERTPEDDIVLLIEDTSGSQRLDKRDTITAEAMSQLQDRLSSMPGTQVRTFQVTGEEQTKLGEVLRLGLSDIPRRQLAGVLLVTDGRSADPIPGAGELGINAPVHLFMTGREDEIDRRIEIVSAPRYGIVRETASVKLRIVDEGIVNAPAIAILRINGKVITRQKVAVGKDLSLTVPLDAPGKAIIDVEVSGVDGELTLRNNRALFPITVIRDRLRVLLVSGEPHAGERVWRNLLKSDPAVDLVHFTILKPFQKEQPAPNSELALIPFPEDDLFLRKLPQFDVLIFDRYTYRTVMNPVHFDAISAYVRAGGAMLIAAGPEFTEEGSIATQRNLSYILSALPAGRAIEQPYLPTVTAAGHRHPVTTGLEDYGTWGRWLRAIPTRVVKGDVLMEGPSGTPLLVVSRIEKGRVGMLLSDHVWLWARGFDGGGPHREFLRRLVHWLMKEPQLEEEALVLEGNTAATGGSLMIKRRTMSETVPPVDITGPDGTRTTILLKEDQPGLWLGTMDAEKTGIYEARTKGPGPDNETLYAIAAIGLQAPPEFAAVTQTSGSFAQLLEQTTGAAYPIRSNNRVLLPAIRKLPATARMSPQNGRTDWAGLARREASSLDNIRLTPLFNPWVWAFLLIGFLVSTWLLEGRRN